VSHRPAVSMNSFHPHVRHRRILRRAAANCEVVFFFD
jgi:hypothetical protein